jgi:beta-phosphoglucomutase
MSDFPRAVLFDFDGVIVNSEPVHLRAFQRAASTEAIALSDAEYFRELIGYDDPGAWRRLFELHRKPLNEATLHRVMERKFAFMRELLATNQIPPLPGVVELLRALRGRAIPTGICSGAVRYEIETMLAGVRLARDFDVITAADDVAVGKPDPQGYLLTARRLSEKIGRPIEPRECLVIEDAPAVARGVRSVGFKALLVATSYPIERLRGAGDWVVQTLRAPELASAVPELRHLFDGELEHA